VEKQLEEVTQQWQRLEETLDSREKGTPSRLTRG